MKVAPLKTSPGQDDFYNFTCAIFQEYCANICNFDATLIGVVYLS